MAKIEGAVLVQYVFLDVVRFTQGRTIEAQIDVVAALNRVVRSSLEELEIHPDGRILLPTGDGLAIALLQPESFDVALKLAQSILQHLHAHNSSTEDTRRQFELRIGVNQNIDNLVIDINGNLNIAGRGINQAQRIMSSADGEQILLGESIYEILCEREDYAEAFRELSTRDKHGNSLRVYQLIRPNDDWLKTSLPSRFQPSSEKQKILSEYAVHFIAHAFLLREFLLDRRRETSFDYTAAVLLHLLSLDSIDALGRNPLEQATFRVKRLPDGDPSPSWNEITKSEFWVRAEFQTLILRSLSNFSDCFEMGEYTHLMMFPSPKGIERARTERPDTWAALVPTDTIAATVVDDG